MNNTERMTLWDQFLQRWPIDKIKNMTLEEYVSVDDQDTFTYWLETKTRELGSIQGNTSIKFGIYRRRDKSDPKPQSGKTHGSQYSWYSKYGANEAQAFETVKTDILNIINAVQNSDLNIIDDINLSPMVKWKIAFLYQNQTTPCLINVFSKDMLKLLVGSNEHLSFQQIYQKLLSQQGDMTLLEYGEHSWNRANKLAQDKRNKLVIEQLIHHSAFKNNYQNWPEDTLTIFCELALLAEEHKLDFFTTNMTSGDSIRIGRKEVGDTNAKEVFATFEAQKNTIKYAQRYQYRDAYFVSDMADSLLAQIKKSKHMQDFNAEYPIDRNPNKPKDYLGENSLDDLVDSNDAVAENESTEYMVGNMSPLNQILYGPPGTGKTYYTIEAAVKAAEPQYYASLNIDAEAGATKAQRSELTDKYKALSDAGRIRFVTFHQSYGYEEFVEGLRANSKDGDISYDVEPGVFKSICSEAKDSKYQKEFEVKPNAKVWKISIDGTGQSVIRDECFKQNIAAIGWGYTGDLLNNSENEAGKSYHESLGPQDKSTLYELSQGAQEGDLVLCIGSKREIRAVGIVSGDYKYVESGTLHRDDYRHTLPVNWLVTDISINFYELNGNKDFTQKTFYHLWRFNASDVFELLKKNDVELQVESNKDASSDNYVLIIDEINRGNISKIFGELITLIEPSKRSGEGQNEALDLILPYSGAKFTVPNNLHIIGTMNTADRSLAMMDTALRRRFDFVEMMPNAELFNGISVKGIDLQQLLETMNKRIEVLYDREHTLGHAFFMHVKSLVDDNKEEAAFIELKSVFKNKVIPLLEEYFFEDWNKIRLVLGDNRKEKTPKFIVKSSQSYDDIFGYEHGLDSYETESVSYKLASFGGVDSAWNNEKAYIGIYSPSLVNSNNAGNE